MTDEPLPVLSPATAAVRDFMHASRELGNRMAQAEGRSSTDATALGLLDMLGPLTPSDLAHHLGIRTPSATVLVDRLVARGDVRRAPHAHDRRRVLVHLEEEALARGRAAWGPVITAIEDTTRALPAEHQEVVHRYLTDLADVVLGHPGDPRSGDRGQVRAPRPGAAQVPGAPGPSDPAVTMNPLVGRPVER